MIEFDKKAIHRRFIEYRQATVSYDTLTIEADRVRLTKGILGLVADGDDVVVEDGTRRLHVKQAETNFRSKDPLASLTMR